MPDDDVEPGSEDTIRKAVAGMVIMTIHGDDDAVMLTMSIDEAIMDTEVVPGDGIHKDVVAMTTMPGDGTHKAMMAILTMPGEGNYKPAAAILTKAVRC
jgi:hypothetical protein